MKTHKVKQCPSTDGQAKPHTFVELEPNSWIEIDTAEGITHRGIHKYIAKDKAADSHDLRMATRYLRMFCVGLIDLPAITD